MGQIFDNKNQVVKKILHFHLSTGGGMHHRLQDWQNNWEWKILSSSSSVPSIVQEDAPTSKFLSNFADEHLFHCTGEALKHWYKHILHHCANTCRHNRENIQLPERRGESSCIKKNWHFMERRAFSLSWSFTSAFSYPHHDTNGKAAISAERDCGGSRTRKF